MKKLLDATLYPGYETAIKITEKGYQLCVSLKNKFINQQNCLQKILEYRNDHKNGALARKLEEYFVGKSIMANYGNFNVYKVDKIDFDKSPETYKFLYDGIEMKLIDYYYKKYGKSIKDKNQPLFSCLVKNKETGEKDKRVYFVPELMNLAGLDPDRDYDVNKTMTRKTKLNAHGIFKNLL